MYIFYIDISKYKARSEETMQIPTSIDAHRRRACPSRKRVCEVKSSRSIEKTMYRGSRALLASVTCRTDPTRLPFLATEDEMYKQDQWFQ